jgi:hypothetical protein
MLKSTLIFALRTLVPEGSSAATTFFFPAFFGSMVFFEALA